MLAPDFLNLSDLSVYYKKRDFAIMLLLHIFNSLIVIARLCLELLAGSIKKLYNFFKWFRYYNVPLRDLKTWKSGEEK